MKSPCPYCGGPTELRKRPDDPNREAWFCDSPDHPAGKAKRWTIARNMLVADEVTQRRIMRLLAKMPMQAGPGAAAMN